MALWQLFTWGFCGGAAAEVVMLNQYYVRGRGLPKRYSRTGFWTVRVLLASIAGGLAVAYQIDKPLLAFNIGVATPLIIQAFAKTFNNNAEQ
jgi:hypothetical protein